jgi:CRP-like cAMP-binding protein
MSPASSVNKNSFMLFQSLPVKNRILAHLPAHAFATLQPYLRRVRLKRHDVLQEPRCPLRKVYFIESGVAAMFANTKRDGQVEVGLVGRFGFIGVPVALGTMLSIHRCVMEVGGEALQIKSKDLRQSMDEQPVIRQQLMNYVQALLIQNSQTVLCNALHQLQERLARWLLLARDRLDGDVIPLTHELFSLMLGVRRAGITTALAKLELAGAVRRRRGAVEIVNRALLERKACECYRIIAAEYRRLADPVGLEGTLQSNRHDLAATWPPP